MSPTTVGTIQLIAKIDTSQYKAGAKAIENTNKNIEDSTDKSTNKSSKSWIKMGAVIGAAMGAAQAVVSKTMSAISSSIGGAVRRVDTLNNASRTFENIGFKSTDVAKSMDALKASILGLPTPLDSAVRGMTSLASTYGDIDKGQKVFSALNNAILGFGGTTAEVENAITQLSQLPMNGPLDAQTWNSLRNSGLTPVLVAMAKDMGLSVDKMKAKFGEGELKVSDFTNALVKMNTEGGGGMKSLEQIARDATGGIGTGWQNMQTAITRGVASIIETIGSQNISNAITRLGSYFESALKNLSTAIDSTIRNIKSLFQFINRNKDVFGPLAVGAGAAAGAMATLFAVSKGVAAFKAIQGAIKGAQLAMFTYNVALAQGATAMTAFNIATGANPLTIIIVALAAVTAGLVYFLTKTESGRKVLETFSGWLKTVGEVATEAWWQLQDGFDTAQKFVTDKFNDLKDTAEDVINNIVKWIKDWRYWIQNIGIVIGTVLLPKIVQIGIQWGVTAAQAVVAFVSMTASAVVEALKTSAAWLASASKTTFAWVTQTLPKIIAGFVATSISAIVNAAKITGAFIASSITTLVRWGVTFATMAAGFIMLGVQAIAAGARMALGMMLALGPIGLIIAVVAGLAALIIANWDTVKGWLTGFWRWLTSTASNAWNTIKSFFSNMGKTIGDAVGNAFKAAINGILGFLEKQVNSIVDIINGAISAVDKITPGSLPRIGRVSIPRLAEGGIVTSPTLALVGEGRESEAVIPLSKLDKMLSGDSKSSAITINIDMSGVMTRSSADERAIAKNIIETINQELRAKGLPEIGGGKLAGGLI